MVKEAEAEQVLKEDEEFFEEMKRLGDRENPLFDFPASGAASLDVGSNHYGVDEIEAWLRQRATPAG